VPKEERRNGIEQQAILRSQLTTFPQNLLACSGHGIDDKAGSCLNQAKRSKPPSQGQRVIWIYRQLGARCYAVHFKEAAFRPATDESEFIVAIWHGWHAFRRGLASNLYRLGVSEKVVQAILRHSKPILTKERYIKTFAPDVLAAMNLLEHDIAQRGTLTVRYPN
jgi:hypothetical protein